MVESINTIYRFTELQKEEIKLNDNIILPNLKEDREEQDVDVNINAKANENEIKIQIRILSPSL